MNELISPTIKHLRSFKRNPEPRTKGNKHAKLTRAFAEKFCSIISQSDESVFRIIAQNPDFPSFNVLYHWQQRVPWFHEMWKHARIKQTMFLAHKCIEIAKDVDPKTAHVARVRFDIYRWFCAKFNPEIFAEKPALQPTQTTVNVGISISPERLGEIRAKLDSTRSSFTNSNAITNASHLGKQSCTLTNGNGVKRSQHEHANGDHDHKAEAGSAP